MNEIADHYFAVWTEPDPDARRAAIAKVWAPDGVEYIEGKQFRGHAELEARVTEAHDTFLASGEYILRSAADAAEHGDIITGTSEFITPDGEVVWSARVFLVLTTEGLIAEDYQLTVQPLVQ
jgi:hypothetical protein